MENSSINPVTEAEVRNFAEKIVTSFVSLSEQSRQLSELKVSFYNLELRVNNLVSANESLKGQVDTLVTERDQARKEVQEVTSLLKVAEEEREKAKEEVRRWSGDYDRVKAQKERVDDEYQRLYESYQQSQRELQQVRNELAANRSELERSVTDLEASRKEQESSRKKLDMVENALKGIGVIEETKASEEARADITAMPQPAIGVVEAPKPVEEPWWKSQQARQW